MNPPPHLPTHLQVLWLQAAIDGETCGLANGLMEQNPYELLEPLYDAWHTGWLEGIVQSPPRRYGPKEFRIEQQAARERLVRFRSQNGNFPSSGG